MYYLIEYNDNYAKRSSSLCQYSRDKPDDDDLTDSELFKFKSRFTKNTGNAGTVNMEIAVSLKHLSNFWRNANN